MKKITIILLIVLLGGVQLQAQAQWSLNQCIDYALEHNIQVKQTKLQAESSQANLKQTKLSIYPNLNANASDAFQYGRTIDPYTNLYTDQNVQSFSLSVSSQVTLFQGLKKHNSIKKNNYTYLSNLQEIERVKNSISMQVATAYLQILFDKELLEVAKRQMEITKEQVERTKVLVEAGSLAKGNLLEIQAQLAQEEMSHINAQNNIRTDYLSLTQLLELDSADGFEIEIPQIDDPSEELILASVDEIYQKSTDLPRIKKQELNVKSADFGLKIAKGGYYPRLYLNASYGTGYSSARSKYDTEPADPRPIGWVDGSMTPVYTQGFNTITLPYDYIDQLNDNRSFSFVIGISIPIFNNWKVKTDIINSKLNYENAQLQLELTKNNLYKEIQQAHNAAVSALAKFRASKRSVEAQKESFSYTKQKFDLGLVNSVDYNTAKNQLTKAESDMVQAKYDFVFRINILNFYMGKPFKL